MSCMLRVILYTLSSDTDIFKNIRDMYIKHYELDPAHFVSAG